jgi:hypothetical protein
VGWGWPSNTLTLTGPYQIKKDFLVHKKEKVIAQWTKWFIIIMKMRRKGYEQLTDIIEKLMRQLIVIDSIIPLNFLFFVKSYIFFLINIYETEFNMLVHKSIHFSNISLERKFIIAMNLLCWQLRWLSFLSYWFLRRLKFSTFKNSTFNYI